MDCNGVEDGPATLDNCLVCNDSPEDDDTTCVQDCAGTWAGDATSDHCGVCDSDATNDDLSCEQDCDGVWAGPALLDECGVCDADVTNDCVEDCAGVWGGDSQLDNCLVCDSDPENDCPVDCAGVNGGDAVLDDCGVYDADSSNDNTLLPGGGTVFRIAMVPGTGTPTRMNVTSATTTPKTIASWSVNPIPAPTEHALTRLWRGAPAATPAPATRAISVRTARTPGQSVSPGNTLTLRMVLPPARKIGSAPRACLNVILLRSIRRSVFPIRYASRGREIQIKVYSPTESACRVLRERGLVPTPLEPASLIPPALLVLGSASRETPKPRGSALPVWKARPGTAPTI